MMEKILFVNACPRPQSRSLELARHVLGRLEGEVEQLDIFENGPEPLDWKGMQLRDSLMERRDFSHPVLSYAVQFAAADTIVIAAPYWDLMFPAVLKAYLEAVTVTGLTFYYNEQGIPTSLCRAGRLIYVSTAGGYTAGANFGFDYTAALAKGLFGISDVKCVMAEGLDIWGNDAEAIMAEAKTKADILLA